MQSRSYGERAKIDWYVIACCSINSSNNGDYSIGLNGGNLLQSFSGENNTNVIGRQSVTAAVSQDSGSNPLFSWEFDVNGAAVATRPLWQIDNNGSTQFELQANGNLNLEGNSIINYAPFVQTIATASSITPNADQDNDVVITALAANLTINLPSGTAKDGQTILIDITDNGTSRTLTWNGSYVEFVTAPTATVINKSVLVGLRYSGSRTQWEIVSIVNEP